MIDLPPNPPRAADVLAARLYDEGCRLAFGMPGGEVLTLVDALERAGIRFVLCKHENAAAFMAEGAWHRTGAPAILVATVGPGALNGVNAVANAHQDRVPMIVLSGCVDADEVQTYTHQVLDQTQVFAPITKATFTLNTGAAHVIADKAVTIAVEGRPGPVHIDVPISVADTPVAPDIPTRRARATPVIPAPAAMAEMRAHLAISKRPVLIVGVDALNQGFDTRKADISDQLRAFVDFFDPQNPFAQPQDFSIELEDAAGLTSRVAISSHSNALFYPPSVPDPKTFNDPVLDRLVARASEGNLDLQVTLARLKEARARLRIASGERFPDLNAFGTAERLRLSDDGPLIAYRCLPSLNTERRNKVLKQTQASSDRLGEFISEGIKDGSIRDVNPGIIENAIAGTIDAAPAIAEMMRLKDNSKVSAEYLELFFNGIANRA